MHFKYMTRFVLVCDITGDSGGYLLLHPALRLRREEKMPAKHAYFYHGPWWDAVPVTVIDAHK